MNAALRRPGAALGTSMAVVINFACVTYMALSSTSPPMRIGMPYYVGVSVSLFLWLGTSFALQPAFYLRLRPMVWIVVLNITYMLFAMIVSGNTVYIKLQVGLFLFYFYALVYMFWREYYPGLARAMFWIVVLTTPIWCVITIRALSAMPLVVRQGGNENLRQGIGGYFLVYAAVLFALSSLCAALYARTLGRTRRVYLFVHSMLCVVLVIMSGYVLASMCLALGASVLWLDRRGHLRLSPLRVLLLLCTVVVLLGSADAIVSRLVELAQGTPYAAKIMLLQGVSYADADVFVSRLDTYRKSLDAFFEYPLWGSMFGTRVTFGWHSTILDSFAQFGLLVGMLNVCVLLFAPLALLVEKRHRHTSLALMTVVSSVVILLFDNVTDAFGVGIFLVFPCAVDMINATRDVERRRSMPVAARYGARLGEDVPRLRRDRPGEGQALDLGPGGPAR